MAYKQKIEGFQESVQEDTTSIVEKIKSLTNAGDLRLLSIVNDTSDLDGINTLAKSIQKFDDVIILGTGGSSLTGQALIGTQTTNKMTNITFLENIDPDTFTNLMKSKDLNKTFFITISKSGETLETITQFLLCASSFQQKNLTNNFLTISDSNPSTLRSLSDELSIPCIDHDAEIGGRFSIFSNVALLPAAISGMNIAAIRHGAAKVLNDFLQTKDSSPVHGAARHLDLISQGISCNILMIYIDRLANFAMWYRQLWAESIGKHGHGTTPVKAMGTIDQHSQLQLYLDGPKDKFFTLLTLNNINKDLPTIEGHNIDYLQGKTMGDVLEAEFLATKNTLLKKDCPLREIRLDTINEESVGALAMHFILETIMVANMLEINPFDQPAVEDVKSLAREILGNK